MGMNQESSRRQFLRICTVCVTDSVSTSRFLRLFLAVEMSAVHQSQSNSEPAGDHEALAHDPGMSE